MRCGVDRPRPEAEQDGAVTTKGHSVTGRASSIFSRFPRLPRRGVLILLAYAYRDRPKHGGANVAAWKTGRGARMEWRVTIELSRADGTKQTHEVARGGGTDPHSTLDPLGLTLDDGKMVLAGVQRHLVRGRVAEYSALRRRCSHCQSLRPLKDTRARRLNSLFGTVEVPAPRFKPCRCAIRDAVDAFAGIGAHARPVHPRIRADIGEAGGLVAISPCPAVPVRVLPYRR